MSNCVSRPVATSGWRITICSTGRAKYSVKSRNLVAFRAFFAVLLLNRAFFGRAFDQDAARAGFKPDAGNRVLSFAGGIGAVVFVDLALVDRCIGDSAQ